MPMMTLFRTSVIAVLMITTSFSAETKAGSKDEAKDIARVRRILKEAPLIDGHNDLPWQYRKRGNDFSAINLRQDTRTLKSPLVTDIARLREGCLGGQFWSVYIPTALSGPEAVKAVLEQIDVVHHLM